MNLDDPQERSAAAGEYVMGTLDANDRARFETALQSDADLRAEVYRWQDRLLTLALRVEPVTPQAGSWAGIEQRLAPPDQDAAAAVVPRAVGTTSAVGRATEAANDAVLRRLRVWRTLAGFAIAACLVLAVLLIRSPTPGAPAERYLALLQSPEPGAGPAGWLVEVTAGKQVRLVPLAPSAPVPPGKALQFWTKLEGAAGPTSLGLVPPGQVTELPASELPGVAEKQLFELTLEPEAGSPIGRPTGPILYVGRSFKL